MSDRRLALAAALCLAAFAAALVGLAAASPWTQDEPNYLHAGMALRRSLDFDAFNTILHGPLTFYVNQLFLPADAAADPEALPTHKLAARLGALPFALLAAAFTALLARDAFGGRAALAALVLLVGNPLVLGHGCLITGDMPLTAGFAATAYAAGRALRAPSWSAFAWLGAAVGVSLATKYLGLFLLPALALAFLAATLGGQRPGLLWSRAPGAAWLRRMLDLAAAAALCGAVALLVLHTCYLWRPGGYRCSPQPPVAAAGAAEARTGPQSDAFRALVQVPGACAALGLLPAPWVRGVDYQKLYSESGVSYFAGRVGPGFAGYFATAFAVKLPLPLWLLLTVGLLARTPPWPRYLRPLLLALVGVPIAYLSLATTLQIGVRYALPIVPVLTVVAARGAARLWDARGGRAALAVLGAWLLGAAGLAWPNYVGWFNALGGDQPYKLFSDSNLDWQHRGWSPDRDRAALQRRTPDGEVVSGRSGARFGRLLAHGPALTLPDPRDPTRAYHWLWRFRPVDREGAWFAFAIDEIAFRRALADARPPLDPQGQVEFALALAGAGRPADALVVLQGCADADADRVRGAARLLAAGRQDDPALAQLWLELGRFDLVLAQRSAPVLARAYALFWTEEPEAAAALLADVARERPLLPGENLLLASAWHAQGRLDEALAVLERSPPPAGAPERPAYERLQRQLREQVEDLARAKLRSGR